MSAAPAQPARLAAADGSIAAEIGPGGISSLSVRPPGTTKPSTVALVAGGKTMLANGATPAFCAVSGQAAVETSARAVALTQRWLCVAPPSSKRATAANVLVEVTDRFAAPVACRQRFLLGLVELCLCRDIEPWYRIRWRCRHCRSYRSHNR